LLSIMSALVNSKAQIASISMLVNITQCVGSVVG
jgi:hypothetical protein